MIDELTIGVAFYTIKVLLTLIIFGVIAYKMGRHHDKFTWIERTGMGFIGGGSMMLIAPITFKPSPFDDWVMTLFLLGNAVYFIGRLMQNQYWKR